MIIELIQSVIDSPTEDNIQSYKSHIDEMEYSLLKDAESFPFKSQEYFSKRTEAFSYRRETSMKMITAWVKQYGSTQGCPSSYADTLNIPFREIKKPK